MKDKFNADGFQNSACTEGFTCKVCGLQVAPDGAGSQHRNHCPQCLSSVHLDGAPGDRASVCKGVMDAISVWVRKNGEWAIIHRCKACGALSSNRVAADDNPVLLMSIAVRPLAMPPFPLSSLVPKQTRGDGACGSAGGDAGDTGNASDAGGGAGGDAGGTDTK